MHRRWHARGVQSCSFEPLEVRQLLTASPLEQELAIGNLVGPFASDDAVLQMIALSESVPSFGQGPFSSNRSGGTPVVTVDDDVIVAQGFPNANGSNPAPLDGRYFRGFPSMEILPSGRIISVFAAGQAHGAYDTQARWTYSDDNGATWSTPVTMSIVVNGVATSTLSPESIWRIPNGPHAGRLLFSFWDMTNPAKSRMAWSDDEGQTWSNSINSSDPNPTFETYHYGAHPIQLADGSLLATGYAHVIGQSHYVSTAMRSTDGGQSWNFWSTIRSGAGVPGNEQPEEPCLLLMDNGQILCMVRDDISASIRTYISADGTGSTWTEIAGPPFGAFRGFGKPSVVQDDLGTIICITRDAFTTFPVFFVSRDHGASWSGPNDIGPDSRFFAYGDLRAVGDGKIALIYGVQSTSTYTRSDVRFTYLNDILDGTPAPVLDRIGDRAVDADGVLTFTAHATDPNSAGILYSLGPGAPPGATIHPLTGAFSWNVDGLIGTQTKLTVIASTVGMPTIKDTEVLTVSFISPWPVATVTGPATAFGGEAVTFTVSATDSTADMETGFRFEIDWGDGLPVQTVFGPVSAPVIHRFAASGQLTVRVTAFDQAGHGSLVATTTIQVDSLRLQPNAENPTLVDLVWAGTPGNDHIELEQLGGGNTIRIRELLLNGLAVSRTRDVPGVTGRVIALGHAGDDVLDARGMASKSVTLNGNAGNNTLYGGNGGDLLIGGSNGGEGRQGSNVIIAGNGNNTIYGNDLAARKESRGGNNLIVGGSGQRHDLRQLRHQNPAGNGGEGGQNLIVGGGGSDMIYASQIVDGAEGGHGSILIAGSTTLDESALLSVLSEWTATRTYEQKLANIQGTGTPDRTNGDNFLQAGTTISDDGSLDEFYSDTKGAKNWLLYRFGEDIAQRVKLTDTIGDL